MLLQSRQLLPGACACLSLAGDDFSSGSAEERATLPFLIWIEQRKRKSHVAHCRGKFSVEDKGQK